MSTVFGMFDTKFEAESVIRRLQNEGIDRDRLSLVMKHSGEPADAMADNGGYERTTEGAALGLMTGAAVGLFTSLLIAGTTMFVPGLGLILIAGPITAALTGAAVGGVIGMGIPKEEAEHFSSALERGQIIVAAHVDDADVPKIRGILEDGGSLRTYNT